MQEAVVDDLKKRERGSTATHAAWHYVAPHGECAVSAGAFEAGASVVGYLSDGARRRQLGIARHVSP
jgi:hypothetical protein